jgi:hypothetical protein
VNFRFLFALLIGIAMTMTPLGMQAAVAAPAMPHHETMALGPGSMDHCAGKPKQDQPKKAADKNCCAAACVGIALTDGAGADPLLFAAVPMHASAALHLDGVQAELPTPPPRSA